MGIVLLEGSGQLKKSNDLIGNRTHDLPPCSIVPQPTTVLRVPLFRVLQTLGRAIAQAVSRRLPTAATRVQIRVWACGIL
jgi:hypothetical protein